MASIASRLVPARGLRPASFRAAPAAESPPRLILLARADAGFRRDWCELFAQEGYDTLAPELAEAGIRHLDIAELRGRHRDVTQRLARHLFSTRAAAGAAFRSHLDDGQCAALFEDRGRLITTGDPIPLAVPLQELHQVCEEFGLNLDGSVPQPERWNPLSGS